MNKRIIAAALFFCAAAFAFSQGAKKGPLVDRVYFDIRIQQDIAIKDTAEGKTDVFLYGVQGNDYRALSEDTRDKLDDYEIPSGSWSLEFNPVPNAAPYTVTVGARTFFNPFAIREVRFAMNFLVNRKYIVDEILGGSGASMFTMATPGQPGTFRYNLIPPRLGFTATGNEKQAIADITAAIAKASELPELQGKLVKEGDWWMFDGEPVSVKFLIRVDEPNGRLKEGRYIADQIEKAGIKVERLEYDRRKCITLAYDGNPADYQWNIYTEGWGAGATRAWWDNIVAQAYAPWVGNMPGGQKPEFWNYANREIDRLTQKIQNGQFIGEADYWDSILRATELGIRDAVRVYICDQDQFYLANKARFNQRMVYGLGDGLDDWSLVTADVKPEKNSGEKILHVTQLSAKGSLFMGAWDPVGVDGFNDMYSLNVVQACADMGSFESPVTALDTPWRVSWKDVQSSVKAGKDGTLAGQIPVPEDAVLYASASKTWKKVGPGVTSFSKATYTYKWGKWHTGRPITIADIMYAQAFTVEWMNKDGPDDRYYDATYESSVKPGQQTLKGIVLNKDGTFTTYYNFNHISKERIGASGSLGLSTYGAAHPVLVSWEISEALSKMVAEGSKSGTAWSFSSDPAFTEVDVLNPKCLDDIKAKLQEFKAARYVPGPIRQWKTAAEAVASYDASIAWIDAHKNAYISNGPFFINNVDLSSGFVELRANRDPSYPFEAGYWNRAFRTVTSRIDAVEPPAFATHGLEASITVRVSQVDYPAGTAKPAGASTRVSLSLVSPAGEKVFKAAYLRPGVFVVKIPAADMNLAAGSYTIVAQSAVGAESPSVAPASLNVF